LKEDSQFLSDHFIDHKPFLYQPITYGTELIIGDSLRFDLEHRAFGNAALLVLGQIRREGILLDLFNAEGDTFALGIDLHPLWADSSRKR
jgi:hypothetical protein